MKRILHPTDFSDCARQAEQEALSLLHQLGGELLLVHVSVEAPLFNEGLFGLAEPQKVYAAQRKWAVEKLEERAAEIRRTGIAATALVRSGVAVDEIVETARTEKCDLIVMGTHGLGGLNRLLIGSVADRVVRQAPCPILLVRETRG